MTLRPRDGHGILKHGIALGTVSYRLWYGLEVSAGDKVILILIRKLTKVPWNCRGWYGTTTLWYECGMVLCSGKPDMLW